MDVTPLSSVKREGETLRVLCRINTPIQFCRFIIPGEPSIVVNPAFPHNKFKYIGEGFDKGQCGIEMQVEAKHNGQVECHLAAGAQELMGESNLLVGNQPDRPEMEVITQSNNRGAYEANSDFRATCIIRNGRPAANITWMLGDQVLTNGLTQAQMHEENGLYTVAQEIQRRLQPSDDGLDLVCRGDHVSYPNGFMDTKVRLNVKCGYSIWKSFLNSLIMITSFLVRPMPQADFHVDGLVLGQTAMVNFLFRANPKPRIEWYVDGTSIPQGAQRDRFEASEPRPSDEPGEWATTLTIADLTLEDTTKEYYVKATNEFGATEYKVLINSSANDSSE